MIAEHQTRAGARAQFKKFPTQKEALNYVGQGISTSEPYTKPIVGGGVGEKDPSAALSERKVSASLSAAESLAVQEGYTVSPEGYLVVYCDGSSLGNGKAGAKAGLGVYWGMEGEAERR